MRTELDFIDRTLLSLLQRELVQPIAKLAAAVGLTTSPCWRRVQRLEKLGVIKERVALLDRRKLGLNLEVFVEVRFSHDELDSLQNFEEAIRAAPEVLECFMLMGQVDFLLRVITRDVDTYERFLRQKLAILPGVRDIKSSIALSTVKSTTILPLDHLEKQ
ncbi:MAG: Lrp/AsnC family transcriptional regulator [Gammaproteobacteria bacterium]|nr:Lrp/AsnC family transcriptional regulator [Gammaproteobacteria bacterium]